jgi:hypothetical protein
MAFRSVRAMPVTHILSSAQVKQNTLTDMTFWTVPTARYATSAIIAPTFRVSSSRCFSPDQFSEDNRKDGQNAHGVLTISAPKARSITSFSMLILAGKVMIHLYSMRISYLNLIFKHLKQRWRQIQTTRVTYW